MNVGFIGTGVMGRSMAGHLTGHQLYIYNRTKEKAESLLSAGAVWCDTPAAVADHSDIVFTMLGYPHDVEQMYLSSEGLLASGRPGQLFIDCTTSSPELAARIAAAAEAQQMIVLDAPVSGGDIGAMNGTLSVMVGGDEQGFMRAKELIDMFSGSVQYFGAAGSGQHVKMANQIAIASGMIGVAESLYYAEQAGLDLEKVLETIAKGAAGSWSLSNLAPRMLQNDYQPGFYTHHFIKDMGIALKEAEQMNIKLPGLELAYQMYNQLSEDLKQTTGTHIIIEKYRTEN